MLCCSSSLEEADDGGLLGGQQRGGYVGIPASSFVPPEPEESWDQDDSSESVGERAWCDVCCVLAPFGMVCD